jgi:uncharacterized membrane protein YbhN (UPF0104 family)
LSPRRLKGVAPTLLSAGITAAAFWFLFRQIDAGDLLTTLRELAWTPVVGFVVLHFVGVAARALRFWILLGRGLSYWLLIGITLVRGFFVDLLPARLGELSLVYLMTRAGRRVEEALAILLIVVLLDLFVIAPLLLVAILVVRESAAALPTFWLLVAATGFAAIAWLFLRFLAPAVRWMAGQLHARSRSLRWRGLAERLRLVGTYLDAGEADARLRWAILLSLVIRLAKFGAYYLLVLGILARYGVTASVTGFFTVFLGASAAELGAALPIHGLAGFGTYEAAWAIAFEGLGFPREQAIVSGVLAHGLSQALEYLVGGIALVVLLRGGWRARRAPDA